MAKRQTKRALITSVISLLVCFSMLVGTTFAWFTDSVTSSGNIIKSGTLDVTMHFANGEEDVPTQDDAWTNADGKAIFVNDLWEPGYTEARHIKIENKGTLALKYQIKIAANGEVSDLAKVIDVYYADPAEKVEARADVSDLEKLGTLADVLANLNSEETTAKGSLKAGSSDTITLVLKMQESAGNEYQNKSIGSTFSIILLATQDTVEEDSFDDQYDADAKVEFIEVSTAEELANAINAGENATLTEDIETSKTLEFGAPSGASAVSSISEEIEVAPIILDLNGNTIKSTAATDDKGNKVHVIKNYTNLEIVNGSVISGGVNGGAAIYNESGASLTLDKVTVVGSTQSGGSWPSYALQNFGEMNVKSLDLTSTHGAIAVYGDTVIDDANVVLNGFGGSSHVFYIGGEGTDLTINGGSFTHKGNVDGSLGYIMTGTNVVINGGSFSASNGGYGFATYTGSLTVNGGTFANAFLDWGGPISISGGTFASKPNAAYIAPGYEIAQNDDGTWSLKAVWLGETNVDWYLADPNASEFVLSTAAELAGLAAIVNGTAEGVDQDTFSGQTIKLAADIDLANYSWTTIGRNHDDEGADPFCGTFDGQGHTVRNLSIEIEDNKRDSVGFIGLAKNATIKGLTIENVYIDADYFVGAIVGKLSSGEISDCHVKGNIDISARRNYAAGIVGDGYYDMENCSVIANKTGKITSKAVAGGLCGRINEGAHSIKNCTVKNMDIQSGQQIAALSGFVHYGNTVSGCNVENVKLTLTATKAMQPAIGLVSGLWYYKESAPITMSDNVFKNVTISALSDATGTADILYGWEWNDNTSGVVASNNTMVNVTNKINYITVVNDSDELVAAINAAADGDVIYLAEGGYALRFSNNVGFNVDNLTFIGMGNVTLSVSSSEVWYGRVQGDNVSFENVHFTSSVGATGEASYVNCVFDDWTICASGNNEKTYFTDCTINGCLNTSSDFSSGDTFVKNSTVAKAEFSGNATMNFENCAIGELISWDMSTVLNGCTVEALDASHMTSNSIVVDGEVVNQ